MKLILKCFDNNEWSEHKAEYALLDLTPALAATMLARLLTFAHNKKIDRDLEEMRYGGAYEPTWFDLWANLADDNSALELLQELVDSDRSKDSWRMANDFVLPGNETDVEGMTQATGGSEQMVVRENSIAFCCEPKYHDSVIVETAEIPLDLIREAVEQKEKATA
jgi:hypothetical protein